MSAVEFAEDGEGADGDGGFGVILQVAEDGFAEGVAGGAVEGKEHRLGEGGGQERLKGLEVLAGEGGDVVEGGTEAQDGGVVQKEPNAEVGEIAVQCVQSKDTPHAPVVKAFFCKAVAYAAVQDFRSIAGRRAFASEKSFSITSAVVA